MQPFGRTGSAEGREARGRARAEPPFTDPEVRDAFDAFPDAVRAELLGLRTMIHEVARDTPGVGPLTEALRWGQPAYLTRQTGAGSTIRLGVPKSGGYAIYVHCQTTILAEATAAFPGEFRTEGNRAVHFGGDWLPRDLPLRALIRIALTYHLRKR